MGRSIAPPIFTSTPPDPQVAQLIGQWAEHYRKEKALLWLGQECRPGRSPAPCTSTLTCRAPAAPRLHFGQGQVLA